jgi:hypothetical protein
LSIIYPADDPRLAEELTLLRRCLPPHTPIVAGGRSASNYKDALDDIGALIVTGSAVFRGILNSLRGNLPAK